MPSRLSERRKWLTGTAKPSRLPKTNAAAPLDKAPPPPEGLSGDAKAEWRCLAPAAVALGTLTKADLRAFGLLTEMLATAEAARRTVAAAGYTVPTADGGSKPHACVRIMETARGQAHRLLGDFGLTPRGRQGVDVVPPRVKDDGEEFFAANKYFR
jgi:P27 family predicted phage terminase small subunit